MFLAFCATGALIVVLEPLARRLRLLDIPGGRKAHARATPVIGGIAIFGGFALAILGLHNDLQAVLPLIAAGGLLVLVGALDDRHDIRKRVRLMAQLLAVLMMVYWSGIRVDSLGDLAGIGAIQLGILSLPFTVLAVMGVINAVNMTDGADGLAGGLSLIPLICMAGLAFFGGRQGDGIILLALVGSVLAFMLFNYRFPGRPCARVFMGDAGSTFLGFAICWFAISLSQGGGAVMSPILAVWLIGIPVLDLLTVMARRMLCGRSPLLPDRSHLHHILQREGMSPSATVNAIVCGGFLAAAGAMVLHYDIAAPDLAMVVALVLWATMHFVVTQAAVSSLDEREAVGESRALVPVIDINQAAAATERVRLRMRSVEMETERDNLEEA